MPNASRGRLAATSVRPWFPPPICPGTWVPRGLDALSFLDVASLRGTTLTHRHAELLAPVFAEAAGIALRD